jgi:hypothetical protein
MILLILILNLDISIDQLLPAPLFDIRREISRKQLAEDRRGLGNVWTCSFDSQSNNNCWQKHGVLGLLAYLLFRYLSRSLWVDFKRLWMNFIVFAYKSFKLIIFRSTPH